MKTVELMIAESKMSLRKALVYSGSSRNLYYYEPRTKRELGLDASIVESVKRLSLERPSYGTRRTAATLARELRSPVNRKRIQRIFRVLNWTLPARKKSEIIRSSTKKLVQATRPYELWETDLTYVWSGIDGWSYLFNVEDVFQREWSGYAFDTRAVKENAIMSVNNALAAHPQVNPKELTLRCDNGSQYRSRVFRESMKALGIKKLEFIHYNTPEQNGHVESFHKTLKKEYLWCRDFKNYQEAEIAIADAFKDYNENRIHSALGYKTPSEFLSSYFMKIKEEEEEKKV